MLRIDKLSQPGDIQATRTPPNSQMKPSNPEDFLSKRVDDHDLELNLEDVSRTRILTATDTEGPQAPQFRITLATQHLDTEGSRQQDMEEQKEKIRQTVSELVHGIVGDVKVSLATELGYAELAPSGGVYRTLIPLVKRPGGVNMSREFPEIRNLVKHTHDIEVCGRGPTSQTVDMFYNYTRWLQKPENVESLNKKKDPIRLQIELFSQPEENQKGLAWTGLGFMD